MTDNNGYVLAPLPVAPVNETDMVLLPKGLTALKQVAKEVGLDLRGASAQPSLQQRSSRPSCGLPAATSAGQPLAWGAAGHAWARRVPGQAGQGGRADPRRGDQREQQVGRREKWLYFSYTHFWPEA